MAENLSSLVNQVLESPQLRNCIQNCLSSQRPNLSIPSSSSSSSRTSSNTVQNELRRLFPSIRPSTNNSKRRKKDTPSKPFLKEIILVKKTSNNKTLTGLCKAKAYEEGYALSAVQFNKNWTKEDIKLKISESFQSKLNGDFEILIPISGYLVKPNLSQDQELDGANISKIFYNKVVYVRPLDELVKNIEMEQELPAENILETGCEFNNTDSEISCGEITTVEVKSLAEILTKLQKSITDDEVTIFNVYREDIFQCCLRAIQRKSFAPTNIINVNFTDTYQNSENAIDAGGPKREMFRLVLDYFGTSSKLFEGVSNKKIITFYKENLEKKHYFEAGRLIALAIVHASIGPRCFSETFFKMLVSEDVNPNIDDIVDIDVKTEIEAAINATNLEMLQNVVLNGRYFQICGWEYVNNFNYKEYVVKDMLKFYVLERCRESMEQFVEGLNTLNVYNNIKQYPEYFIELLCYTDEGVITLSKFESLVEIDYSEEGSNKRNVESKIAAFWKDFVLDCEENDCSDPDDCKLPDILAFCTGSNIIPALGFPTQLRIKFLHDECSSPYPKANTCALELHLPIMHSEYKQFKYNMSFGIKNGMVFGFAIIEDAGIEVLKRDCLLPYSSRLRELTLVNLENFYYFEAEVFAELKELEIIYIQRAPKLLKIQADVFNVNLPKLKILRIVNTGLEEMPNLNNLNTNSVLHMIDLEHNNIKQIQTNQASSIKAEQLLLNYNNLEEVQEEAFHGSQIAKLSLKGNKNLQRLHKKAFSGLQSLRYIDLSNTAITMLPTEGLREIDVLKIQETQTLQVFPSVFNFQFIKEAWLTYPYHCCAFKFPHTHNPWEFERHRIFRKQLEETCVVTKNATKKNIFFNGNEITAKPLFNWPIINNTFTHNFIEDAFWNEEEIFHNDTLNINTRFPITTAVCGELYVNYHEVMCHPAPDAFNPCEDLMGNWILRVPVWFISFAAVIGNLFVIIVISTSHFRLTVSKFLMCNLAVADFCIGAHLLILALVDTFSIGVYFNYAIGWQEANGCKVAGFLTIFGNILSVYTLTVITTERWYTITWAIHLNRRLKLRTAVRVMLCGWICAIFMASLPLFGVSNYSKTSICLPLENKEKTDVIYLSTLLIFNAFAFVIICVCYGSMYKSIKQGGNKFSTTSVRSDLTVAKRMALLVFTDFACWAPIAFFGLTALVGYPLITVTESKILLVFFYPLNSCANPYLYALLTQQYRRDFFILMGRYGLFKDRAERHKGAIGGKPLPYGSGLQYKRTNVENNAKCNSANNSNRHSVLTTFMSVDIPIGRTNSRYSQRSKHGVDNCNSLDLNLRQINNCDSFEDYLRYTSTENL